jgi:hypothetical protein
MPHANANTIFFNFNNPFLTVSLLKAGNRVATTHAISSVHSYLSPEISSLALPCVTYISMSSKLMGVMDLLPEIPPN